MSALVDLSATEIREKIAARQVSAVEYVSACLARVDQLNEALNAIVTFFVGSSVALKSRLPRPSSTTGSVGPSTALPSVGSFTRL